MVGFGLPISLDDKFFCHKIRDLKIEPIGYLRMTIKTNYNVLNKFKLYGIQRERERIGS